MMVVYTTVSDNRTKSKLNVRSKEVASVKDGAKWVLSLKNRTTGYFSVCGLDLIGHYNVVDFEQGERW